MKQSGETSKICSFSLIIIGMLIYLFIFSSTLFLLAYVNCIFVKKLIKMSKKDILLIIEQKYAGPKKLVFRYFSVIENLNWSWKSY